MPEPTTEQAITANDVAAALEAAVPHAQVLDHEADPHVLVVASRDDRSVTYEDLERYLTEPVRARGAVRVFTAAAFVAAYEHRVSSPARAVVYADPDQCRLVAVLNDDTGANAGWRDHRINLILTPTPEWEHWYSHQGPGSQERFAQVIEDGETEIVEPSATFMLDLAQTFHATYGAKVKRHNRLTDGRTQLVWEEDIEASAGEAGELMIPATFTIRVGPFYGANPIDVTCRLRYQLERGGDLKIGYQMVRPDEVRRISFAEGVLANVRSRLPDTVLIEGVPADATTPGR